MQTNKSAWWWIASRIKQIVFLWSPLVFFSTLSFGLKAVHADLLVVLLKSSHVLSGLGELSLLHALSDVPVDEGTLGVHQVELVVKSGPRLCNGGRVAEHADGPLHLGEVASRHHGGRLVVDTHLEACGTPVDELDGPLGLDRGNGRVDVLGYDVSPVEHAAGHVLAVPGVALHHLVGWLEARVRDLSHRELLVVRLLCRDDRSIRDKREMDPGVGHQVGLELCQVHVEGPIEPQGGCDGGDDLADQPVQVGVRGPVNVQVATADVVDGLVVHHEGAVRVLEGGVSREDRVVRLDNCSSHLRCWVDGKLKLGLLAVVHRESLHKKRSEARASAATEGMEDEESLESSALVRQLPHPVEHQVDDLLADGVVAPSIVVGSVLLAGHQLLRVEELAVRSSSDFVDHRWLEVNEDSPRDVLASPSLREEGVEGVVP